MLGDRRYPSPAGIFVDRKLKQKEKRHLKVYLDLGRDADVLAVSQDHPACTTGDLPRGSEGHRRRDHQTWSAAGVPAPPGGNSIALRRAGTGSDKFVEPRFGAGYKLPTGARKSYDGGLGEAASGNSSIAAVTSWSRARSYGFEHVRRPRRRLGAHGRLRPRALAPQRLPDLVRDAEAPQGREADRVRRS